MSTIVANRIESLQSGQTTFTATPYVISFLAYELTTGNGGNSTLVYQKTQHNVGSAYSTSTGKFTAPVKGIYQFSASILRYQNDGNLTFRVNNDTSYLDGNSNGDRVASYATDSTYSKAIPMANLQLNANDEVTVYVVGNLTVYANYNHFSGHLIGAIE